MKLYRSISMQESYEVFMTGNIKPSFFEGNEDSTCPKGTYSFWFNVPVEFEDPFIVVEADIKDYEEYQMSFGMQEDVPFQDYKDYNEYQIPEFVVSDIIKPSKVWFNKTFSYIFKEKHELDLLEITEYEDPSSFIQWCLELPTTKDKFVSVRDYGSSFKDIKGSLPCAFRSIKIWLFNDMFMYGKSIYNNDKSGTAIYHWNNKKTCDYCNEESNYFETGDNYTFCYSCVRKNDSRNKKWDDDFTSEGIKVLKELLCIS